MRSKVKRPWEIYDSYERLGANNGSSELSLSDLDKGSPSTARLHIDSQGSVQRTWSFLNELFRNPRFRLLKIEPDEGQNLEVWLGLRGPTQIEDDLTQMTTVYRVAMAGSPAGVGWQ